MKWIFAVGLSVAFCWSAQAQIVKRSVSADQFGTYQFYKQYAKRIIAQEASRVTVRGARTAIQRNILSKSLRTCPDMSIYLRQNGDDLAARIQELAGDIAYLEYALRKIPKSVWSAQVSEFEENQLESVAKRALRSSQEWASPEERVFFEKLAADLEKYEKESRRKDIPLIIYSPCEYGMEPAIVEYRPEPKQVLFTTRVEYEDCQRRGFGAKNIKECGWIEAGNFSFNPGRYYFLITWDNKPTRPRLIELTNTRKNRITPVNP